MTDYSGHTPTDATSESATDDKLDYQPETEVTFLQYVEWMIQTGADENTTPKDITEMMITVSDMSTITKFSTVDVQLTEGGKLEIVEHVRPLGDWMELSTVIAIAHLTGSSNTISHITRTDRPGQKPKSEDPIDRLMEALRRH